MEGRREGWKERRKEREKEDGIEEGKGAWSDDNGVIHSYS